MKYSTFNIEARYRNDNKYILQHLVEINKDLYFRRQNKINSKPFLFKVTMPDRVWRERETGAISYYVQYRTDYYYYYYSCICYVKH